MKPDKPPVIESAGLAWRDTFAALVDMPGLLAVAIIAGLSYTGIEIATVDTAARSWSGFLLGALITVLWAFFLTPIYLAIHRYIILGERVGYVLAPHEPRFQRFLGYSLALYGAMLLPTALVLLLGDTAPATAVGVFIALVAMVASICLMLLFPAVAVDAPGATAQNAFDDAHGCFWRMVGISLLAIAPLFIAMIVVEAVLGERSWFVRILNGQGSMLCITLLIAVASRLYQRLGNRLNGTTGPATA